MERMEPPLIIKHQQVFLYQGQKLPLFSLHNDMMSKTNFQTIF